MIPIHTMQYIGTQWSMVLYSFINKYACLLSYLSLMIVLLYSFIQAFCCHLLGTARPPVSSCLISVGIGCGSQ